MGIVAKGLTRAAAEIDSFFTCPTLRDSARFQVSFTTTVSSSAEFNYFEFLAYIVSKRSNEHEIRTCIIYQNM